MAIHGSGPLRAEGRLEEPETATLYRSNDGTVKHLWRLADGELVESVLIGLRTNIDIGLTVADQTIDELCEFASSSKHSN